MAEPPTSEWSPGYDVAKAMLDAPMDARWKRLPGTVRHVFTHFPLELTVFLAKVAAGTPPPPGMRWASRATLLDDEPVPGAMRKVFAHALDAPVLKPAPEKG
jgi:A/G-specific adenine glycosylase